MQVSHGRPFARGPPEHASSASTADRPEAAREHRSAEPHEKRPPPAKKTNAERHSLHDTDVPRQLQLPNRRNPTRGGPGSEAQGPGEPEAGEHARVDEVGDGGDPVALERQYEQPYGVRDRGVPVAAVATERRLCVRPRGDELVATLATPVGGLKQEGCD